MKKDNRNLEGKRLQEKQDMLDMVNNSNKYSQDFNLLTTLMVVMMEMFTIEEKERKS